MNKKKIVIGARGSKLATKYAERAIREIKKFYSGKIELRKIITKGDKILNRRTSDIGGKGEFVKNIEKELISTVLTSKHEKFCDKFMDEELYPDTCQHVNGCDIRFVTGTKIGKVAKKFVSAVASKGNRVDKRSRCRFCCKSFCPQHIRRNFYDH